MSLTGGLACLRLPLLCASTQKGATHRQALYIPKAQVFEDFTDHILIFNEYDNSHLKNASAANQRMTPS
jgi:hypothetical protein